MRLLQVMILSVFWGLQSSKKPTKPEVANQTYQTRHHPYSLGIANHPAIDIDYPLPQ